MILCYSREASVPPGHGPGEAEAGVSHPDHSDPQPGPEPDLQAPGLHAGLLHNRQTLIDIYFFLNAEAQDRSFITSIGSLNLGNFLKCSDILRRLGDKY